MLLGNPQSKKCFINASQTMNIIIADIKLPTKAATTEPIIVPRTTIQIASVNFALRFTLMLAQLTRVSVQQQ